jgi:ribosome-associated translation inhibitor RaiA
MEAHVIVSAEKYRHTAEITLKLRGQEVASREEAQGARVALERATDRLEHQMRRIKERRLERRRGGRTKAADQLAPPSENSDDGSEGYGEAAEE